MPKLLEAAALGEITEAGFIFHQSLSGAACWLGLECAGAQSQTYYNHAERPLGPKHLGPPIAHAGEHERVNTIRGENVIHSGGYWIVRVKVYFSGVNTWSPLPLARPLSEV